MMSDSCQSCGSSAIALSDTFGESVCTSCGAVASTTNVLVHREVSEGEHTFFEASTRLAGNGLGGSGMYGYGRVQDAEGNRERGRQMRLETAKRFMSSLVRLFHAASLEDRAMFLYQQQDSRRLVTTDMIKYVASAAFALVAREKKRQETLKDMAHAADLSLLKLSRVYVKLQISSAIGITEVDPLVFIERHIVHLQNIVKDPSAGIIVNTWETKGRAVDLCGTLDHLKEADLREVRRVAIRLSEFFHDIYLFAGRHAMSVSIAIINVALEAVTKKKLSRAVDIPEELSKVNNVASWTVMERYREAGKMFLDWAEYLPGVDLSLRDIIPAGANSKAVKRRLCRRREIALLTLDVVDQWQSIRDRRVALGLEKPQPPRKTKLADLPTDGLPVSANDGEVTKEMFVAGIEQWGKTAAVGKDAEALETWDDLEPDDEDDWSDVEDPLGLAADGTDDDFPDAGPSEYSRPPSPTPVIPGPSASQVLFDGPVLASASGLAYPASSPHETLSGYPTPFDDFSHHPSYSSSPSSYVETGSPSLAMDPALLSLGNNAHQYQGLIDPCLLNGATALEPADLMDLYPLPSTPVEPLPLSPASAPEVATLTASGRPRRAASVAASVKVATITKPATKRGRAAASAKASKTPKPPVASTKGSIKGSSEEPPSESGSVNKGSATKRKVGPDPRFLRFGSADAATVIQGRKAVPALIAYKPSVAPFSHVSSSSVVQFPGAPASSVGAASDFSTIQSGPAARVVLHRQETTHVRPAAYMRHRPSDVLKNHAYVHLKPAVLQSVRAAGQATTELGQLILAGHTIDELPVHLAPQSVLGVTAALRANGVDDIADEELFVDGELEGYVRPPEEQDFVSKMWDEEGKWDGLEQIIELRERREREQRERDERRAERAERRRLNGGKYVRAGKTKATKEMMDKLKALADLDAADDGGDGDIGSLMREFAHLDDAGLQRMPDREDTVGLSINGEDGKTDDEKHDDSDDFGSDDESDYGGYATGPPAKKARVDARNISRASDLIDPALYATVPPSAAFAGQSDHDNMLAGMDLMNAMRGGTIMEEDEYGEY